MDSMAEINSPLMEADDLLLSPLHPGKDDSHYVRRRKMFFYLARDLRLRGFKSPPITYTNEESELWCALSKRLSRLHESVASRIFLEGKEALNLGSHRIPQLAELENYLQTQTGSSLIPAEGLLHGKTYFNYWANRVMPCTLFMRHHHKPEYTPEPDIVHDVIGHVPPLMNREYVELIQRIGVIASVATPEQLEQLVRFYWFSIEFGLLRESGVTKILGAGILSSVGEIENVLAKRPSIRPFSLGEVLLTKFDPTVLQPVLFVAPSLEFIIQAAYELEERFRENLSPRQVYARGRN